MALFEDKDLDNNSENFEMDLSDDVYDATKPVVHSGNKNSRATRRPLPRQEAKRSGSALSKFVKLLIAAVVLVLVVDFVISLIPGRISLDHVVDMTTEDAELALGLTFASNSSMAEQINHYSKGELTVDGDGEVGIVYIDGVHVGIHMDSEKYSLFGVKIGDSTSSAEENMTFKYDNYMSVVNDSMMGMSTALFYYNEADNDCLVVIYNDITHRAVAITYFNDYKKVTETLSFF